MDFTLTNNILNIKRIGLSVLSVARKTSTTRVPLLMDDSIMMTSMVTSHAHRVLVMPTKLHGHSHIYIMISLDFILYCCVLCKLTSMSAAVGHQLCLKTLLTDKFRGDFRCDPALTLLKYVFMLISIIHWTVILSSILAGVVVLIPVSLYF